jgi:DNA-binding transcriptional ArsR family regulator
MAKREQRIRELAQVFHLMGNESRLRILVTLQKGEVNVTHLCRGLGISQPTVSRHLAILRMGGLVQARRSGKEIFYSLGDSPTGACLKSFRAMLR